jgi:hypothetical protein
MSNVLYKVTVSNVKDIWTNSIKTADSANIVSFSGKAIAAKISGIDSIAYDGASTTAIIVNFDQNVGANATDVANYVIDGSILTTK